MNAEATIAATAQRLYGGECSPYPSGERPIPRHEPRQRSLGRDAASTFRAKAPAIMARLEPAAIACGLAAASAKL